MSQLKESSNASSLGSFDSFIHLFHLGARLQAYNQLWHPIYKFSMKFLDEIHQNLIKFGEVRKDDLLVDDDLLSDTIYLQLISTWQPFDKFR